MYLGGGDLLIIVLLVSVVLFNIPRHYLQVTYFLNH